MPSTNAATPSELATPLGRYRLALGMSQEELAAKAGISVTSVSYLERGLTRLPHRDTVQLLGAALDLTVAEEDAFVQAARTLRRHQHHACHGDRLRRCLPPCLPRCLPHMGDERQRSIVTAILSPLDAADPATGSRT